MGSGRSKLKDYFLMTISIEIMVLGIYFFKFPNNLSFGGVTGLAVVLSNFTAGFLTRGNIVLIMNMLLLVVGFIFLGKSFGIKTVYCSVLMSLSLQGLEYLYPMTEPLTNDSMLEVIYAVFLPAVGSAILFNIGASSGGTDIIAMLLRKYTDTDIGKALFLSDFILTLLTFPTYGIRTGLISLMGLGVKSLVIDTVIESINLCKYVNIICDDPKPITTYIENVLKRSATVSDGLGAYSGKHKYMVLTVVTRKQAIALKQYLKKTEPASFIIITNTSEIVGKGFYRA